MQKEIFVDLLISEKTGSKSTNNNNNKPSRE